MLNVSVKLKNSLKEESMKKIVFLSIIFMILSVSLLHAGILDDIMTGVGSTTKGSDDSTIVSGLKEALSIGTEKAVKNVSQTDGYFGNQLIKILMPEKIQKVADVLKQIGYQQEVDNFILSMNRAAEKAAPQAASFFVDAIKEMTFDDARKILNGGDTSATDFFKGKTHDKLYNAFRPVISSSMNEVGVTRSYKEMMSKYETIPFMGKESLNLDNYVTNKSLDGLFYMLGQEEKRSELTLQPG